MYLLYHLQNNTQDKIDDEVLWEKGEWLLLDAAGFLSLLEEYFCDMFFFPGILPVVIKYFFPL